MVSPRTLYTVRITTTVLGGDLSHGASLQITTVLHVFNALEPARLCLIDLEVRAVSARAFPGVEVEVELSAEPSFSRLAAAC